MPKLKLNEISSDKKRRNVVDIRVKNWNREYVSIKKENKSDRAKFSKVNYI